MIPAVRRIGGSSGYIRWASRIRFWSRASGRPNSCSLPWPDEAFPDALAGGVRLVRALGQQRSATELCAGAALPGVDVLLMATIQISLLIRSAWMATPSSKFRLNRFCQTTAMVSPDRTRSWS